MYSVEHKKDIPYSIDALNADQKYCATLHFADVKNHSNINLLPSWHPYWRFRVYLRLKQHYVNKIRTLNQYKDLYSEKLNIDTKQRVWQQIISLTEELKYKQYQDILAQL